MSHFQSLFLDVISAISRLLQLFAATFEALDLLWLSIGYFVNFKTQEIVVGCFQESNDNAFKYQWLRGFDTEGKYLCKYLFYRIIIIVRFAYICAWDSGSTL